MAGFVEKKLKNRERPKSMSNRPLKKAKPVK
jgi:hypothetical protein